MLETVPVTAEVGPVLLPTAAEVAADEAEPEILVEIAAGAGLSFKFAGFGLDEITGVIAGDDLLFPSFDLRLFGVS